MIRLMTQTEAAKRLGISTSTLKRWRERRLISYLPGSPVMFDEKDIEDFAAAQVEAKRKEAALNEPGTPEHTENALSNARRRAAVAQLRRQFAAKWRNER